MQLRQLLLAAVVSADGLLLEGLQLVTESDQLLLLSEHSLLQGERGVPREVETLLQRE